MPLTRKELKSAEAASIFKELAHKQGFISCRISRAEFLSEEAPQLESWLKRQLHGKMAYMENHFDKRLDPTVLVPGCKSLVTLVFPYHQPEKKQSPDSYRISEYAWGRDYHKVLKSRLKMLWKDCEEAIGKIDGRIFVDSGPVLEKAWARKNGTGWMGKNTNIIHPKMGSFFFLCEMLVDIELEPDGPLADHCGTCTRCLDACPTDALFAPYQIDASRCISYLTIELKEAIPSQFAGQMDNWIFGCDVCQEVCPWNHRFARPSEEPAFEPRPGLLEMNQKDWQELTQEVFDQLFEGSAVKRTGYEGLKRNIRFLSPPSIKEP